MVELFANSGDPDQMLHSAASDLGLHCLAITLLGVSILQWVKKIKNSIWKKIKHGLYTVLYSSTFAWCDCY